MGGVAVTVGGLPLTAARAGNTLAIQAERNAARRLSGHDATKIPRTAAASFWFIARPPWIASPSALCSRTTGSFQSAP